MSVRSSALLRVAVLLTVAVTVLFLLLASGADAGSEAFATEIHRVQPGETLWEIASSVTSQGADVRRTIDHIKELNGMATSMIYMGDRLIVPASGA